MLNLSLPHYFFMIVIHIFSGLFQNAVKLGGMGFIANITSSFEDTGIHRTQIGYLKMIFGQNLVPN
jgi:hypothetical protein